MTSGQNAAQLGRGQLQQRAIRGALWTGIHTMMSLPVAFLVNILLARVLGPEGYGRLAYLTTVITIATVIAGLGVTSALVQFGAKAHAAGQPDRVRLYLSGAQGFRLLVMGPIVALAVVAIVRVDWWLLVVALLFGVGAPALFGTAKDGLTIENRTDRSAQLAIFGNLITQSAVVVALLVLGTADAVWSARVIASGLIGALPLFFIATHYRKAVLRPRAPWRLPRQFWRFAIPTGIAGIIAALTSNRIEVIFLDWFSTPAAMGIFGLAFGLAGHVYAPAQALMGPLLPAVSGLAQVDGPAVRRAFLRVTRVASAIGGLLVASALPPLAILVPVLYGREFAAASQHVVLLGLASGIALIGSPHHAFLMARLGGRRLLGINVVALVVNIGLAFALIPVIGVWGASICCSTAMVVRTLLVSAGESRALAVPSIDLVRQAGGLIVGILTACSIWGMAHTVDVDPGLLALASFFVGVGLFVGLARILGVGMHRDDRDAIVRGVPRRLQGVVRRGLSLTAHYRKGEEK